MSIEISRVCFSYGNRQVLRDVSFSANPGDLLFVLGPNGVGKSTLFRCMLGLEKKFSGSIKLDGQDVRSLAPAALAKKIAYIPQSYTPAFHYSVFHTVLMGTTPQLSALCSPGKAEEDAVMKTLERFGIAHLRDRDCARISGGERQLTLIARAVVQQAKILVMDEPTANLDYGNQVRVMEQIRILASQGYAVILSTHNPEHALLYANRVLVLFEKEVLRFGVPQEMLTEEVLGQIFRVKVHLSKISTGTQTVSVCVPLGSPKEDGNVFLE